MEGVAGRVHGRSIHREDEGASRRPPTWVAIAWVASALGGRAHRAGEQPRRLHQQAATSSLRAMYKSMFSRATSIKRANSNARILILQ